MLEGTVPDNWGSGFYQMLVVDVSRNFLHGDVPAAGPGWGRVSPSTPMQHSPTKGIPFTPPPPLRGLLRIPNSDCLLLTVYTCVFPLEARCVTRSIPVTCPPAAAAAATAPTLPPYRPHALHHGSGADAGSARAVAEPQPDIRHHPRCAAGKEYRRAGQVNAGACGADGGGGRRMHRCRAAAGAVLFTVVTGG